MSTFEEKLTKLEKISQKIKEGELPLEKLVSEFEVGMTLAKELEGDLQKVESKVEVLVNHPKGDDLPRTELFE